MNRRFFLPLLAWAEEVRIRSPSELSAYQQTALGDYLLFRSGKECHRCEAVHAILSSLLRDVQIPVLISEAETTLMPIIELHRRVSPGRFESTPYDGQMTMSQILKFIEKAFMQDKTGKRSRYEFRKAASLGKAVTESHERGRVPFVAVLPSAEALDTYAQALRLLEPGLNHLEFLYTLDKSVDEAYITVSHRGEIRLSNAVETPDAVATWIKEESLPQFGRLSAGQLPGKVSTEAPLWERSWIVLIGGQASFELFEHEFRSFASAHRDSWRAGWIDKGVVEGADNDWEKLLKIVLNTEENLAEAKLAGWQCEPDCVIGRRDQVIKHLSTVGLSAEKLEKFANSFSLAAAASGSSSVADLRVEYEARTGGIAVLAATDFQKKVLEAPEPLLLLLRLPEEARSLELRSVFESVAGSLSQNGIRFYEMVELPPPDRRYAAYEEIPHLWFKPSGVNADPMSIPWEAPPPSEPARVGMASVMKISVARVARKVLMGVNRILARLIASLNQDPAPEEL